MSESDEKLPDQTASHKKWSPQAVKELRMRLAMSQGEFAELVGVERPTVSNWERGVNRIADVNAAELDRVDKANPAPAPGAEIAGNVEVRISAENTLAAIQSTIREPTVAYNARAAEIRGRSMEVEALLAYALERQRLLTQALGAVGGVTQTDRDAAAGASSAVAAVERQEGATEPPRLPESRGTTRPASIG